MRVTTGIRLALVAGLLALPWPARAETSITTTAKQAIALDYDTGTILFEKSADQRMAPSSLTKEMTLYVVFQALQNHAITLDQTLLVSRHAWRMPGSRMFLDVDSQARVEDLIRGVIVDSGNDAAVTLAEGLTSSEEGFVSAMNDNAKKLGMTNTHFANASGLPDPQNYSTARDMATLATHIVREFPEYYHYYAEQEFTYHNIKQDNRNPLLYRNIGADGLKTGHTAAGGYGLMGSGTRGGRRVVFVLNGLSTAKARAVEGARILSWGLKNFRNVTVCKADAPCEKLNVHFGTHRHVPAAVEKDLIVTIPKAGKQEVKPEVVYDNPLQPPIQKGDRVGTLRIDVPGQPPIDAPLIAMARVRPVGTWGKVLSRFDDILDGR